MLLAGPGGRPCLIGLPAETDPAVASPKNQSKPACLSYEDGPLGDRRNMVYIETVTAAGKASAEVLAQHNIALKTVPEVEHASDMRTLKIVCPNFDEQLACFQPVGKVPPPNDSVERAPGTADL